MPIPASCRHCGYATEFKDEYAGTGFQCPVCGQEGQVPDPHRPPPKPTPRSKAAPILQPCPDCGHMVSPRAESCPKCGCPFETEEPVLLEPASKGNLGCLGKIGVAGGLSFLGLFAVVCAVMLLLLTFVAAMLLL